MNMPREPDMVSEIRRGTIPWLGDAERVPEEKTEERVQEYLRIKKVSWKAKKEMVGRC
jgi:hypothetical protein